MTAPTGGRAAGPGCRWCGGHHVKRSGCPYDLHGGDAFKTRCAACGEGIPAGAPRRPVAGNIVCSAGCERDAMETIVERFGGDPP